MTSVTVAEDYMTLEDFIRFEEMSDDKHEYRNGKLYELPATRFQHNIIASRIFAQLANYLTTEKNICRVINSAQIIYISSANRTVYSDTLVYCGKPLFHDNNQWLLVNPVLVVEVLSKSTQSYDKGEKFDLYRTLPSFQEYVLVSQNKPAVQVRYLQDAENELWKFTDAEGLDATIRLQSIGAELNLKDIYSVIEEFKEEED